MQAILLYGSWALTIVVLAIALRMSRKERTPFYFLVVLAVLLGAFVEPIYDAAMMLYFYSTEGMITHFTAFGIPQPLWTHSGYVVLYASAAIFIARSAWHGTLTRQLLYTFAGIELLMSCVFEMIGINGGAYAYWGPHTLRVFNYPLVIGVLEAAQVVAFGVAATVLRKRVVNPSGLLGLFVLFPCTFLGVNFGAGWPTIISIHLDTISAPLTVVAALVSIALAALVIRAAAAVVPAVAGEPASIVHSDVALGSHRSTRTKGCDGPLEAQT
jgi:hypothetical protein